MGRTGVATLPLHYGKAPRWLFERMSALSREIVLAVTAEFGPEELLGRMSDPYRFQHGGKDGTPFPVDRPAYDRTIDVMKSAIERAKMGNRDRVDAIRRLSRFYDV